jgi:ElaB/YqjD/DUF883 family membrane-anchored ribosome-binding protein
MPDTIKELPDPVEVIEGEIEQTREGLADKLEALTQQLTGTVENVGETVEAVVESTKDTISTIKETFNIPKQVEEHPWLAMGCSVLAGFLGGKVLGALASGPNGHAGSPATGWAEPIPQRMATAADLPTERQTREQPRAESHGWLSSLSEHFAPELNKVKGLALGTMFGVIRDMVSQTLPETLKSQVTDVFNNVTEKLGGEPLPAGSLVKDPETGSSSS